MTEEQNSINCHFSDLAICYIYDELDADAKVVFKTHLKQCASCRDEVASFSTIRSNIFQWKENEFQILETPEIHFSDTVAPDYYNSGYLVAEIIHKTGFLESIRNFFSSRTLLHSGAITAALFAVLCGLALLSASYFTKINQLAEVKPDGIDSPANISAREANTVNESKQNNLSAVMVDPAGYSSGSSKTILSTEQTSSANVNRLKTQSPAVKSEQVSTAPKTAATIKSKTVYYKEADKKRLYLSTNDSGSKRQVPKLSSEADEPDEESIRLTDLLEEIGGE